MEDLEDYRVNFEALGLKRLMPRPILNNVFNENIQSIRQLKAGYLAGIINAVRLSLLKRI